MSEEDLSSGLIMAGPPAGTEVAAGRTSQSPCLTRQSQSSIFLLHLRCSPKPTSSTKVSQGEMILLDTYKKIQIFGMFTYKYYEHPRSYLPIFP